MTSGGPRVVSPKGMSEAEEVFQRQITASIAALEATRACAPQVAIAARLIAERLRVGGKVMICGNGGSAAEASHFATELLCRLKEDRPPLAAISLCADGGFLTATVNDYQFEEVFARQVRGLGRVEDVLVGISTSGNSTNVRRALETGREMGLGCVALLGREGGWCRGLAEVDIIVPQSSTARIQEAQLVIIHSLCSLIEHQLFQLDTIL